MTKQTIEQQVVAALTAEAPTLDTLLTLVAEIEAAIITADNTAEAARSILRPGRFARRPHGP